MSKFTGRVALLFIFLSYFSFSIAQDLDSLLDISAYTPESDLQKILNKSVAVSSQKALTTRETPGIISLVTAEDIRNSGARDMVDVLRLIPGFDVMQDLQFVMGIGFRGNWANEGKILVLLDGQPMNELLYQTVALGNHFPVDAIEQIEIIRGPGSAIFGGSAEYGVINIITKASSILNGIMVYNSTGIHTNSLGRFNGGIMTAKKGEKMSWDFSIFKGSGVVSNRKFQDLYEEDEVYDLSKVTDADPMNFNAGFKYKDFSLRTMYDQFNTGDPYSRIMNNNFFLDTKYDFKANEKITITPRFQYSNQIPWAIDTLGDDGNFHHFYRARVTRLLGEVNASFNLSRKLSVIAGSVYFRDKGEDLLEEEGFIDGNEFAMSNIAFYTQGVYRHRLFNATLGARYEKNNRYGSAFVPRIAITKKIENLHFKVLYSQSFRAPSIENISGSETGSIKPEKSSVTEFEIGYQFTPTMLLSVNAFSLTTKNVIVYFTAGSGSEEWYENSSKSGSKGIEVIYTVREKKWNANITYSYSQAIASNTVDTYEIPQTAKQYVGFPLHKITINSTLKLSSKFSFNVSGIFGSQRFAYTSFEWEEVGEAELERVPIANKLPEYWLMNCFMNYQNIFPGFSLGLGVYDMLDNHPDVIQPYNGEYAPIPGRSREYVIKLNYLLNFKKDKQ